MKVSLLVLALVTVAVLAGRFAGGAPTWRLTLPLVAFTLSLIAAVITRPGFRRQLPLLVFHLSLLAVVGLVTASRLTFFWGGIEVTEGQTYRGGEALHVEKGPWHQWGLDDLQLTNLGHKVLFESGRRRGDTVNRVAWSLDKGPMRRATVRDVDPLIVRGYRFYITPNNGFAPMFRWQSADSGKSLSGSVHLPAFPLRAAQQSLEWQVPGEQGITVWIQLKIHETLMNEDGPWVLQPPEDHTMVVRRDGRRQELRPGESAEVAGGRLQYLGLRTYMGYQIFYDPFMPWLLAASLLAAASLAWHCYRRLAGRSWLRGADSPDGPADHDPGDQSADGLSGSNLARR